RLATAELICVIERREAPFVRHHFLKDPQISPRDVDRGRISEIIVRVTRKLEAPRGICDQARDAWNDVGGLKPGDRWHAAKELPDPAFPVARYHDTPTTRCRLGAENTEREIRVDLIYDQITRIDSAQHFHVWPPRNLLVHDCVSEGLEFGHRGSDDRRALDCRV